MKLHSPAPSKELDWSINIQTEIPLAIGAAATHSRFYHTSILACLWYPAWQEETNLHDRSFIQNLVGWKFPECGALLWTSLFLSSSSSWVPQACREDPSNTLCVSSLSLYLPLAFTATCDFLCFLECPEESGPNLLPVENRWCNLAPKLPSSPAVGRKHDPSLWWDPLCLTLVTI